MGYIVSSTTYDAGVNFKWINSTDRVAWQRAFYEGNSQTRKEAVALLTANPETSEKEISVNLNDAVVPPRFGTMTVPLTIERILQNDLLYADSHVADRYTTDFSGENGSYSGTDRPALNVW
jgi:hypothetical protein